MATMRNHRLLLGLFTLLLASPIAASSHYEDWEPETDLAWAASTGDVQRIEELLQSGVAVGKQDSRGRSALMWACLCKQSKAARALIDAEAPINDVDGDGGTALGYAVGGTENFTPCDYSGKLDPSLVADLIAAGADVNAAGAVGALLGPFFTNEEYARAERECLRLLLDAGGDPNSNPNLWSPMVLVVALRFGQPNGRSAEVAIPLLEMLLAAGAEIDNRHDMWGTPLEMVVKNGEVELARWFISHGANVNILRPTPRNGRRESTLLDFASGNAELEQLLREAGAHTAAELRGDEHDPHEWWLSATEWEEIDANSFPHFAISTVREWFGVILNPKRHLARLELQDLPSAANLGTELTITVRSGSEVEALSIVLDPGSRETGLLVAPENGESIHVAIGGVPMFQEGVTYGVKREWLPLTELPVGEWTASVNTFLGSGSVPWFTCSLIEGETYELEWRLDPDQDDQAKVGFGLWQRGGGRVVQPFLLEETVDNVSVVTFVAPSDIVLLSVAAENLSKSIQLQVRVRPTS